MEWRASKLVLVVDDKLRGWRRQERPHICCIALTGGSSKLLRLALDQACFLFKSYSVGDNSDFGSTECNIEIVDVAYLEQNLKLVKLLMNKSAKAIIADDYIQKLHFMERFSNYVAYHIMRISLRVLFYFQSDLQSPFKRR